MTHDLKTSLDDFAETAYADAPPSTIDIGKARADGRRRMVAARLAPIGGGVAVVAACALVVNSLGGATAAGTGPGTAPASGRAFTGTDPLTSIAKFGWLPDGFQVATFTSGPDHGESITARTKPQTWKPGQTPPTLNLTKWPSEPGLKPGETKKEVVDKGSPKMYIVTKPASGAGAPAELSLEWQSASGSWLVLGGVGWPLQNAELQLLEVFQSVTAEESPVALPIHVEGLPKGVTLGAATLDDPVGTDHFFDAGLVYYAKVSAPGSPPNFSITVKPVAQGEPTAASGADVVLPSASPAGDRSLFDCRADRGLFICVQDSPADGVDPLASVGGAKGLLARITSLGTDRKDWTTHVVN